MEARTLHTFDTEYSADSVEWNLDSDLFVCGTYQLQEGDDDSVKCNRTGRIYLFQFAGEGSLALLDKVETNAVLDQKWRKSTLAVADSKGFISLYNLREHKLDFCTKLEIDAEEDDSLALSIDWSPDGTELVVSDSKGKFCIVKVDNEKLSKDVHLKAHEFEAWIAVFDKYRPKIVYTGEKMD